MGFRPARAYTDRPVPEYTPLYRNPAAYSGIHPSPFQTVHQCCAGVRDRTGPVAQDRQYTFFLWAQQGIGASSHTAQPPSGDAPPFPNPFGQFLRGVSAETPLRQAAKLDREKRGIRERAEGDGVKSCGIAESGVEGVSIRRGGGGAGKMGRKERERDGGSPTGLGGERRMLLPSIPLGRDR